MPADLIAAVFAGIGLGGGAIAAYVRLSLPSYTVGVLNGRYPTRDYVDARFDALQDDLRYIRARLDEHVADRCED